MAKLFSIIHSLDSNIQLPFNTHILFITNLFLFSINSYFTSSIPINPTGDNKYLPSDEPNITNLMVSHYDCEKKITFANLTFSMLNNVPKLPLTYNMQRFKPEFMFEQKLNVFALSNARHMLKKKEKFAFKVTLNIDVLIELFGTIIPCHYQIHLILLNVKI